MTDEPCPLAQYSALLWESDLWRLGATQHNSERPKGRAALPTSVSFSSATGRETRHRLCRIMPSDAELSRNGDRDFVVCGSDLSLREKLPLRHPAIRPLKHFARVGLKHQPFSWSEPVDVDHVLISFGQFFEKVMFVTLRLQIDISLRALQRPEVTFHILYIRIGVQQETDHEGRVENSSVSLLLGKI